MGNNDYWAVGVIQTELLRVVQSVCGILAERVMKPRLVDLGNLAPLERCEGIQLLCQIVSPSWPCRVVLCTVSSEVADNYVVTWMREK